MGLARNVYKLTKIFPKDELYALTSQLRRCAVSIPSNVAEGSQRGSDKEFGHFTLIARGSLAELETQLILANDFSYISKMELDELLFEIDELNRMFNAFYSKLKAQS